MQENYQDSEPEEFPDEKSPEYAGCYMYAFYKLGLDPEEARMGVSSSQLTKFFTIVIEKSEADALAIRDKNHGRIEHMVFIDQEHGGLMKQRGNVGWPIEQTSLDSLLGKYKSERYEYIYLKKKSS